MKRFTRLLLLLPLAFFSWSCQDGDPVGPIQVPLTPSGVIFEVPGYLFLGPIGKAPVSDQFLGGLSPTVTVCKWDAANETCFANTTVAAFSGAEIRVSTENVYQVNWDTGDSPNIVNGEVYQIVVRLEGEPLGTADIAVYTNMGQARNAGGDAIALQDGRTLPIRFGIEPQALLEILDVPETQDFVIETFTTDGGVQTVAVPSGDAAFQVDGSNVTVPGGGTEFTLLIAEKQLDPATGRCEPSYGGPNTGGCYLYETFPAGVTFLENGDPAGIAGVCPAAGATDSYDLAKSDNGVTTFPPPPPATTASIVNCAGDFIGQLPWGLRHFARLVLPSPLHAKDEGEMGMVGSFSIIFWAMPVALESFGTVPTGPLDPGETLQLSFRAVQTHGHNEEDEGDHSVPGVRIDFSLPSGAGSLSAASGVTNADGVVTVGWTLPLTEGDYFLTAGVAGVTADVEAGTAANVDVTVQTGVVSVSGTVFYSTTLLSGVMVELVEGAVTNEALRTATTDASGNYTFANVPDGTYHVKAYGPTPEFITWTASQVTVAGENVTRNIDLPKTIALQTPASGSTVATAHPTLTWTANPEAVRYTVQINVDDDNFTLVDHRHDIPEATYTVIPALSSGVTYRWQVDATDEAGHSVGTTLISFSLTVQLPTSFIHFESDRDGNTELYRMAEDGSGATRLTDDPAHDGHAAISPDGSKIAFQSARDGLVAIYVMNADGSGVTQLTNNVAVDAAPDWSPDGTRLLFHSNRDASENLEIYVMNADGTAQTRLTNNTADDGVPDWSPDGTQIVFRSDRDGLSEIYVMNVDGTGQTRLTNNQVSDDDPDWSPDGTKIVFRHGGSIAVMQPDGSGLVALTEGSLNFAPAWSPDGSRVAFARAGESGVRDLLVMNADGSAVTNLTNNTGTVDHRPAWR